jgi:hypothetical protein
MRYFPAILKSARRKLLALRFVLLSFVHGAFAYAPAHMPCRRELSEIRSSMLIGDEE